MDARSDIFPLGIVLYEMLAGRRPFEGETLTDVLSSIIKDTPPAARELRPEISPELSRLVRRCLAKDRSRRIQTALDIRNELEELSSAEVPEITVRERTYAVNKWLAALAAGLLVALGAVIFYFTRGKADGVGLVNAVQLTSAVGDLGWKTR